MGAVMLVGAADGEGFSVGFDFDDVDAPVIDAILAWCFRYPFGPERDIAPAPPAPEPATVEQRRDRALARQARMLAAAESAASSEAHPAPDAEEPDAGDERS